MPVTFDCENLPDIDQWEIKRGRCPWCLRALYPMLTGCGDECYECGDTFVGTLKIED